MTFFSFHSPKTKNVIIYSEIRFLKVPLYQDNYITSIQIKLNLNGEEEE